MAASSSQDNDNRVQDDDDERLNPYKYEQSEWERMKSARLKEGYREGVGAGEETSVQDGFDCGYVVGFQLVQDIAYLRGILCAVSEGGAWHKDQIPPTTMGNLPFKDLIQELVDMEKTILKLTQEPEYEREDCPTIKDLSPTLSARLEEIKTICSSLLADLKQLKPAAKLI